MKNLEQTLDSREVAEMIGKTHANLLKDIRRYCTQLGEVKIDLSDFFKESAYRTEQGKELPCYNVTKKGCEFIANKLTGTKGTEFNRPIHQQISRDGRCDRRRADAKPNGVSCKSTPGSQTHVR